MISDLVARSANPDWYFGSPRGEHFFSFAGYVDMWICELPGCRVQEEGCKVTATATAGEGAAFGA
jgi:hypothetical protein